MGWCRGQVEGQGRRQSELALSRSAHEAVSEQEQGIGRCRDQDQGQGRRQIDLDLSTPDPYDAVIVGSGAAGGWAALTLAERGLRVLVLEAGDHLDPDIDGEHVAQRLRRTL